MVCNSRIKQMACLVLLCLGLLPALSFAAKITHVRMANFSDYTRLVFTISEPDKYNVFTLDHPHRVVLDLYQGHLRADIHHLNLGNTGITAVRSGRPIPSTLRIVFDMQEGATLKSFVAADNDFHEAQLVVDIYPKTAHVA